MNALSCLVSPLTALVLFPLFLGIINRTKAAFAGRQGPPLLQAYRDLLRLLRKHSVYSTTSTWLFRFAPAAVLVCTMAAACFVPVLPCEGMGFAGDVVVLLYLLGVARFFLIVSALDTGSAFEGMGASREAFFSALAEPVTFICLVNVMRTVGSDSIMEALRLPMTSYPAIALLVAAPLFIVLLAESARIPFDDPNTHLELTMIHEVMILDNSGRGLAFMEIAAGVKLWVLSLLLAWVLVPVPVEQSMLHLVALLSVMFLIAVSIGVVESVMARVRLTRVPLVLFGAGVIALLGFFVNVTGALSW
jgi:formate hydrogenlyase subunit 4